MTGVIGRLRDAVGNWLFTTSFDRALPTLNAARRQLGLAEIDTVPRLFDTADRVLVLTEEKFDFPAASRAANVIHVGPVLDEPHEPRPWVSPWTPDDPRPLVLVTTSTYFQDPRAMLTSAISAARSLGARTVVTTGAVDPATLPQAEDIVAARSLPHDQLMRHVQAVVTHCGLGTVHRALIHGVPVLCQPIGRDQPDVAARVVAAGAGLRITPKAPPRRVTQALRRLLSDPSFAEHALQTGRKLADSADAERVVTELEELAATQKAPDIAQPTTT